MVSYGDKWKDSKIVVTVSSKKKKYIAREEISGFHNMSVSLTVPHTIYLQEAIRGEDEVYLKIDLLTGTTFKILGLALCEF